MAAAPDARHHGGRLLGDGEAREEYQGALVRRAGSTGVLVGSGRGSATPLPRPPPTPPPPLTSFPLSRALRGHTPARPFLLDNVWDLGRVLDYLSSRPDVDASRIGVTGISLGGMHAWLLAAADDRVTVAAPALGVQSFAWAAAHDAWHARAASLPLLFDAAAADAGLPAPDAAAFARALDAVAPGLRTVRRHGGRRGGRGRPCACTQSRGWGTAWRPRWGGRSTSGWTRTCSPGDASSVTWLHTPALFVVFKHLFAFSCLPAATLCPRPPQPKQQVGRQKSRRATRRTPAADAQ